MEEGSAEIGMTKRMIIALVKSVKDKLRIKEVMNKK